MSDSATYAVKKPVAVVLLLGILAILGFNVALVIQNRTLKREMAAPPALLPQVGTRIEQLEGAGLDGSKIRVSFAGQSEQTLLFVFSTRCPVCDLNWPQWQSIAKSIQGRPYHLVYANIDSPVDREYAQQYGIDRATVFAQLDPRYEAALNLRLTPDTVLIGQDEIIERLWPGLLNDRAVKEILRHLSPVNSTKGGEPHAE